MSPLPWPASTSFFSPLLSPRMTRAQNCGCCSPAGEEGKQQAVTESLSLARLRVRCCTCLLSFNPPATMPSLFYWLTDLNPIFQAKHRNTWKSKSLFSSFDSPLTGSNPIIPHLVRTASQVTQPRGFSPNNFMLHHHQSHLIEAQISVSVLLRNTPWLPLPAVYYSIRNKTNHARSIIIEADC